MKGLILQRKSTVKPDCSPMIPFPDFPLELCSSVRLLDSNVPSCEKQEQKLITIVMQQNENSQIPHMIYKAVIVQNLLVLQKKKKNLSKYQNKNSNNS
jgi:hypothetical protein